MDKLYPSQDSDTLENGVLSKKLYVKPEIVHELELEVRAGSPFSVDPLDDVTGLFGTDH